jgi:dipeptidase E
LSNSTTYGRGYLDHAEAEIRSILAGVQRVLFVPFALFDRKGYADQARQRLEKMGLGLDSVEDASDPREAVRTAQAIFVGGGNTFRLLDSLHRHQLLEAIRDRVFNGAPYVGSSAGSIVAGPTLQTTKDMPILEPPSFRALGLTAFQISPHYLDPDPSSTHMGETQEERIRQFHEEHATPVVGLREGAMLRVEKGSVLLKGGTGARIFRRGRDPVEAIPGQRIDEHLAERIEP